MQKIVDRAVSEFGSVDILINNAGICLLADVKDFDRSKWDPMVAVNLTAVEMSHEVAKFMITQNSGKLLISVLCFPI